MEKYEQLNWFITYCAFAIVFSLLLSLLFEGSQKFFIIFISGIVLLEIIAFIGMELDIQKRIAYRRGKLAGGIEVLKELNERITKAEKQVEKLNKKSKRKK